MKENRIAIARKFTIAYAKHSGISEVPQVSEIIRSREEYRRRLSRAFATNDEALIAVAVAVSEAEGFPVPEKFSDIKASTNVVVDEVKTTESQTFGERVASQEDISTVQKVAVEVAGPIGSMIIRNVLRTGEGLTVGAIVKGVSDQLGSNRERFIDAMRKHGF